MHRLILLISSLILLAGCSSTAEKSETAGKSGSGEKPFRVALITPGPVSDAGWSAMAYEGLTAIKSELGAEVVNAEAADPAKIRDAMRGYAQSKFDLVIGHGFEYNEPGVELANTYPDTVFISSSGGKTAKNAGAFRFYLEQGFYLAGMTAGLMTKSGKVAMVGLTAIPSIASTFKAFAAGVQSVNSHAMVATVKLDSDKDIAAAKQATLSALNSGCDFVIHQANAAAQGVFDACKEKNAYAFGANLNQNDNASGIIMGSAVIQAKPAFLEIAKQVKEKKYSGAVTLVGMEQKAIDFVLNPALADKIPAEVKAKIEEAKANILSGKLKVPKDDF